MRVAGRVLRMASLVVAGMVFSGATVLGVWMGRAAVQDRLARGYAARVASLPTAEAVLALASLSDEEAWTLAVWCEALGDPRPEVRSGAAMLLERSCGRWCQLPPENASPRLASLAACLAKKAPHLPTDQRPWLRRMAQRLIEQPLPVTASEAPALIAHCQALLLLPSEPPDEQLLVASVQPSSSADAAVAPSPAPAPDTPVPVEATPLPQPPETIEHPVRSPGPQANDDSPRAAPSLAEPRPLVDAAARPLLPPSAGRRAPDSSNTPQQR